MACSEVAAFLQTAWAHYISNIFQPMSQQQWCRFMLGIGAVDLQFHPNFAPFSTLGGDDTRPLLFSRKHIKRRPNKKRFSTENLKSFCPQNQVTRKEKGLLRKLKSFCPQKPVKTKKIPKTNQCSNAHHSQIIGRIYLSIPPLPPPPGFRHPCIKV